MKMIQRVHNLGDHRSRNQRLLTRPLTAELEIIAQTWKFYRAITTKTL